jgi:hypothetical protein
MARLIVVKIPFLEMDTKQNLRLCLDVMIMPGIFVNA